MFERLLYASRFPTEPIQVGARSAETDAERELEERMEKKGGWKDYVDEGEDWKRRQDVRRAKGCQPTNVRWGVALARRPYATVGIVQAVQAERLARVEW